MAEIEIFKVKRKDFCIACKNPLMDELSVVFPDSDPSTRGRAYSPSNYRRNYDYRINNWSLESHGVSCSSCGLIYKRTEGENDEKKVRKRLHFLSYEVKNVTLTVLEKKEPKGCSEKNMMQISGGLSGSDRWFATSKSNQEEYSGILWIHNPVFFSAFHNPKATKDFAFVMKDVDGRSGKFAVSKRDLKGVPFRENQMIDPLEGKKKTA